MQIAMLQEIYTEVNDKLEMSQIAQQKMQALKWRGEEMSKGLARGEPQRVAARDGEVAGTPPVRGSKRGGRLSVAGKLTLRASIDRWSSKVRLSRRRRS